MSVDFYGPNLKVERADHHISHLKTIFRHYVSENVKRLSPERKHRLLKRGQTARPATFPKHTPTVLGDALHNLRAALDHAYCILVEAHGATIPDYTRFPFYRDRQSLEGSINEQKKTRRAPSDAVCDAIVDEVQPYDGGKLELYDLHRLDIIDKHLVLIRTQTEMRIDRLDVVDEFGRPTGGGIQGVTIVMRNKSQGASGDPVTVENGGAILYGNPKDIFDISFEPGQPFERQSILSTVEKLSANVSIALSILKRTAV